MLNSIVCKRGDYMQKVDISLSMESDKMEALDFFLKKEKTSVQAQMDKALLDLYERSVPDAVREYLDGKSAPAPKAKRTVRSTQPKAEATKATPPAIMPENLEVLE